MGQFDPGDGEDRTNENDRGEDDREDEGERDDRTGGFSLGIGLGPVSDLLGDVVRLEYDPRPARADPDRREAADPGVPDAARPPRSTEDAPATPEEFHVDAYRAGDELVVVADLPGVDAEDLSVGVDVGRNCLVVGVDGDVVERVTLPWESVVASEATFNNGVLEVRVRRAEGPDDES